MVFSATNAMSDPEDLVTTAVDLMQGASLTRKWARLVDGKAVREQACSIMERAFHLHAAAGQWSSAAEAATTAAQWAVHDEMDALKFWRLAGRALLKDDSLQQFQQVMETHVVPKLTALGRMQEAAKALQQVGECLLSGGQVDAACAAFERAISLFEADDLGGRGAQVCREQIAQAAIDRQQWKLASTQYAAMHAKDMDHPILKRMGTPKALRSVLCACASGDTVDATRKLEAFEEMDTCFNPTSQDFQLAQGVLTAVIDANVAGFMDCMKAFGEHRLDPWHVKTLLAVKGIIEHGDLC